MAALHAVHQEQQLLLVTQLAQPQQIVRRGGRDAAFALHAFNQNRHRRRGQRGAHRGEVVVRHMPEARHQRLKPALHLVLSRGGNARERAPVKRIERGENFEASLVVAKLAGELEQSLIRLAAAVAEKNFARPQMSDETGGQPALGL